MSETTKPASWVAEHVTFSCFAASFMNEFDTGVRVNHHIHGESVSAVEWSIGFQKLFIRAELISTSVCGPQHFGRIWSRLSTDVVWEPVPPLTAVIALVRYAYTQTEGGHLEAVRVREVELLARIIDSYQLMATYIETAIRTPIAPDNFIQAEQSLIYGHWQHPTPKSRQGMAFWHQQRYAPELGGTFQLQYFAAHQSIVRQASANTVSASDAIRQMLGEAQHNLIIGPGEVLIPLHPLQAEAVLMDPDIITLLEKGDLRHLGPAGSTFTATSSVRTVFNSDAEWMLKFSLPVRITNSIRINRRHELEAGIVMAKLVQSIGLTSTSGTFRIIQDPAYITLDLPGREESGFEIIFRENPFRGTRGDGIVTTAALAAAPLPGALSYLSQLIHKLAYASAEDIAATCVKWFNRYLQCAVEPLIRLYDDFGLALEAHQQNSLIDISSGYPSVGYYRDNEGFYLSKSYRSLITKMVPESHHQDALFYEDAEIRDCFAYYLIVNQVFSIISRMGHDRLCNETVLLQILRSHLHAAAGTMSGAGRDFIRHILDLPTIASKANLTTRLHDVDELQNNGAQSLYHAIRNPLMDPGAIAVTRTNNVIAS
ncbi:hypothetical protein IFT84_12740 [Rhizobium sp. CFBP 8762]|uniref:IucA/IucC family protein n=1 Tax=Rhizobium sp. CFBP 8762 TaxID=2775279 RepID=UPI00178663BA|nr:IucA/IucC family protein [Rhizobium sp. CFBP 8762]MBD8555373.1 hypothetical protein [Rhizobium sp. CFBP 8762]